MRYATPKQIAYIRHLLDRLEEERDSDVLTDILIDLKAEYAEHEDFEDWLRRQSPEETSKIIEYLKAL